MKMTPAQARALGVIPPKKPKTTRKTAKGPYHTICCTCGDEFHTVAAEDRHLKETTHRRFRLELGW